MLPCLWRDTSRSTSAPRMHPLSEVFGRARNRSLNELLGWSAINEIGEVRYWGNPDSKPLCPECNKKVKAPASCCGWYVRAVYETDLTVSTVPDIERGESASKKASPPKKQKTRNSNRTKSQRRSSKRLAAQRSRKRHRTKKMSISG